jgi:hypothetical protein
MTTYKYRIYYEWRGPSASDLFAEEKSPEELDWAFDRFPTELEHRLDDPDAVAQLQRDQGRPSEALLTVATCATADHLTKAMVATLQDWRLFAAKLE